MKITRKDVAYVAYLARLRFTEEQLELFTEQLNAILAYFDKLQELDTTGIAPSTHAVDMYNAFREDVVQASSPVDDSLKNAPAQERHCFKVPKIIEG